MLILSDLKNDELKNYITSEENLKIYTEDSADIKNCLGCFNCWTTTPGCCIINDISREINNYAINISNLVLITEITYGGYSPYIKKIFERMIPNVLPYFKIVNSEVHHAPRYDKYPDLTIIGYGDNITEDEKLLFNNLVKANALNMQCEKYKAIIVKDKSDLTKILSEIGGKKDEYSCID